MPGNLYIISKHSDGRVEITTTECRYHDMYDEERWIFGVRSEFDRRKMRNELETVTGAEMIFIEDEISSDKV